MRSRLAVLFIATLSVSLGALEALAQRSAPAGSDNIYVGLGVGPIVPRAISTQVNGTIAGSGMLKFNASGFVRGLIGYRFSDHVGIEGEGGWSLYDSYSPTGTFSGSG